MFVNVASVADIGYLILRLYSWIEGLEYRFVQTFYNTIYPLTAPQLKTATTKGE
ncbi:hypothetical protein CLOSYM_02395 [[Clostridium] symbiosum ATCC 14940]|uniref:Uncharacterized protein n=1 Tax=[Clostridium] symbiosum ATCC 14940 TaxID=411472 RepID=A0ABC9TXJ0_CLOSY|nr:hypothetical protein CLOSYM_02395 [[Clostridium] symbiosum ATCC 14940]